MADRIVTPRIGEDETDPGAPRAPMPRARFFGALAACLVGIVILAGLGTWQVQRLHWKEGLIAEIDGRMHSAPVDLQALEARYRRTGDVDYYPVRVTGHFLNRDERYFLSSFGGQSGWNVYVPLVTDSGEMVFVNRGFVPSEQRDPSTRRAGQPSEEVTVTGLARNALAEKPGYFVPQNDPVKNNYFWRDLKTLAASVPEAADAKLVPFFIDAGPGRAEGGWPIGGTTVVTLPNHHLQYAITWYCVGIVLLVMTVILVRRDRQARRPG